MKPHVHVGVLEFAVFLLMLIVAEFVLRTITTQFPDTAIGKAVAYIHG